MNKDFFWSSYIQGVSIGYSSYDYSSYDVSYSFDDNCTYTIFDNAASYIYIPPSAYSQLINAIVVAFGNPNTFVKNGFLLIDGTEAEPVPISFMFDNHWITLNPEDYLIDVSQFGDGSILKILILSNSYEFFIMGSPIFQGYYTVFSM